MSKTIKTIYLITPKYPNFESTFLNIPLFYIIRLNKKQIQTSVNINSIIQ